MSTLLGVLIVPVVLFFWATYRLFLLIKQAVTGQRILRGNKGSINDLLGIFGLLGVLLLGLTVLIYFCVVFGTFFLMKSGAASGVPLALSSIAFPFFYGISEFLVLIGTSFNEDGFFKKDTDLHLSSVDRLTNAVRRGKLDKISDILASGIDINDKDSNSETAFDVADTCLKNSITELNKFKISQYSDIKKWLIEWGAIESETKHGN